MASYENVFDQPELERPSTSGTQKKAVTIREHFSKQHGKKSSGGAKRSSSPSRAPNQTTHSTQSKSSSCAKRRCTSPRPEKEAEEERIVLDISPTPSPEPREQQDQDWTGIPNTQILMEEEEDFKADKRKEMLRNKAKTSEWLLMVTNLVYFSGCGLAPLPRTLDQMTKELMNLATDAQNWGILGSGMLKRCMKALVGQGKKLLTCGVPDMVELMVEDTSYTTFFDLELPTEIRQSFQNSWLGSPQGLLSYPSTAATSTLSMPAASQTARAGATSQSTCAGGSGGGWLAEIAKNVNTAKHGGVISQYTYAAVDGGQLKFQSKGEIGHTTVRLEIYPFAKIVQQKPFNWWVDAEWRTLFHLDPQDPDLALLKEICERKTKALT